MNAALLSTNTCFHRPMLPMPPMARCLQVTTVPIQSTARLDAMMTQPITLDTSSLTQRVPMTGDDRLEQYTVLHLHALH